MKKNMFTLLLLVVVALTCGAARREIHILSANDMHAKIQNFPQLSAIVDSLRAIDPQLLVVSAGDYRTGDPLNDQYTPSSYPMVALMNFVGFDCSTLGNHEFDSRQEGLAKMMNLSNFPHICANVHPRPSQGINVIPYKIFNIDGINIGILGVVQLGTRGIPDTHPANVEGITFSPVEETIAGYEWLAKKCDVNILLSHIGYEEDVKMAAKFPYYDLIIGGHSHTQIEGGEMHNGVLITQNVNRLKRVTYTTLTVEDGKVVKKEAENIEVQSYPKQNPIVAQMVKNFGENETFKRKLGVAEKAFANAEELGVFMSDAIANVAGADFAVWNYGGVRLDNLPAGLITVNDVLRLDPFGNKCIEMTLTGKELKALLLSCFDNDDKQFPYTSGNLMTTVYFDPANRNSIKKIELMANGKKLDMKKSYKVVMNSYVASICNAPRADQGRDTNSGTAEMIMQYLEKVDKVNYEGKTCQKLLNRIGQ